MITTTLQKIKALKKTKTTINLDLGQMKALYINLDLRRHLSSLVRIKKIKRENSPSLVWGRYFLQTFQ